MIGIVVFNPAKEKLMEKEMMLLNVSSNNEAKYESQISRLEWLCLLFQIVFKLLRSNVIKLRGVEFFNVVTTCCFRIVENIFLMEG